MKLRIRCFFLLCLTAAAVWTAQGALRSIRGPWDAALPAELYAALTRGAGEAPYVLRAQSGRVAVCSRQRGQSAELTEIELGTLRAADRAMLQRGIPAADREAVLLLLEDLGS